jgi:sugar transferase (PEP-CTERM/EpsH1 system associated)
MTSESPLVLHVIYRLSVGGLENGLVNLINHMPTEKYRHAILCIDGSTDFGSRLVRDVEIIELRKRAGKDWLSYHRLGRVIRRLKPTLVHTRNFGTLDTQVVAALNGVPCRVHGEHGSDVFEVDRARWKPRSVQRMMRSLMHAYVAVSTDVASWLRSVIHVRHDRVHYIPNGVDTDRFRARGPAEFDKRRFGLHDRILVGTVGRMADVKNQLDLVEAFIALLKRRPDLRPQIGLVLIGDGPLRRACLDRLAAVSLLELVFAPGSRNDIPQLMCALDIFVLPSKTEGMSNAIQEAMATALPVIATDVGGNVQMVRQGVTGCVVPARDIAAMSKAIEYYCDNPSIARQHGRAGRVFVEKAFSLDAMVKSYVKLYDSVLLEQRASG